MTLKASQVLAFTILIVSSAAQAQIEKGTIAIGGDISFGSNTNSNSGARTKEKSSFISASPTFSVFILKGFAIGLTTPIEVYNNEQFLSGSPQYQEHRAKRGIGTVMRYYIPLRHWAIFPQVSVAGVKQNFKEVDYAYRTYTSLVNTLSMTGGIGVTYFFTDNAGIETMVFYEADTDSSPGFGKIPSKVLNVKFGIQYYLPNKK
jgi:hypothetical protein